MKASRDFVVTRKEALNMMGIRNASLRSLERTAEIPSLPKRSGYTAEEIGRLLSRLIRILGRKALG